MLPLLVRPPDLLTVDKHFPLPYLYRALNLLETLLAGSPGGGPIRRSDGDKNTFFTDGDVSKAVNECNGDEVVLGHHGCRDCLHRLQCPLLVCRVAQVRDCAAIKGVSCRAFYRSREGGGGKRGVLVLWWYE